MRVCLALPTGPAVVVLFTDIETAAWVDMVRRHHEILRAAIEGQRGVVVKTEGDAFFAALDAVTAAVAAQRAIATEPWTGSAPVVAPVRRAPVLPRQ